MTSLPPERKPLILVVDDDEAIQATMQRYLSMLGFNVVHAPSGEQALKMVGETSPHLIFLDVSMPVMDGVNTLRQLHDKGVTSPVIMLNTLAEMQTAQQALNFGALDNLNKPIELLELKKILQTHLGIKP